MRAVVSIVAKDLLRRLRSPVAPLVHLALPFIFSGLIALAFGTGGGDSSVHFGVAVVDEDESLVGRFLEGTFGQEQMADVFEAEWVDRAEAENLIRQNKVAAAIVIPEGITDSLLHARRCHIEVVENPASSVGWVVVRELAGAMATFLGSAARVLAAPLAELSALMDDSSRGFPPDEAISSIAVGVNRSIRSVSDYLFPPVLWVEDAPTVAALLGSAPDSSGADSTSGSSKAGSAGFTTIYK
ncbi:MAG: hypothetical protein DRG33_03705 [Deltaproteobacteria bacterium]|nr:MAG: hypothetical protein DRG33_03705 [Deltaproteobacteria bacterium]